MAALAMKAGAGASVFEGLPDFPPGRNKQLADEDGNAGAAALFVGWDEPASPTVVGPSFLRGGSRSIDPPYILFGGPGARLKTESLSDGLVDRDFAQSALPVRSGFENHPLPESGELRAEVVFVGVPPSGGYLEPAEAGSPTT